MEERKEGKKEGIVKEKNAFMTLVKYAKANVTQGNVKIGVETTIVGFFYGEELWVQLWIQL